MKPLVYMALFVLLLGCGDESSEDLDLGAGFVEASIASDPQEASGRAGVSSAHPLASRVGLEILKDGGNAADAAAAVGFTLAVVENSMSGLGGRAQILLRDTSGRIQGLDAQTELGAAYESPLLRIQWSGVDTVGVPGVVAGLVKLQAEHGALSLARVMAPAIELAREGYVILPGEVSRHRRVLEDIIGDNTLAAAYLDENKAIYQPGDIFQQPELASTLETIARDAESFYRGVLAEQMVRDLRSRGSALTLADFRGYEVKPSRLVRGTYRGYDIVSMAGPANGTAVIASLNVMDALPIPKLNEADWALVLGRVLAQSMQATVIDDPQDENYQSTISRHWAERVREALALPQFRLDAAKNSPLELPQQIHAGAVDWSGEEHAYLAHHTTHFSVVDELGMAVSITQTLGPNMGAKVMTPGLGFLYAQTGGMPRWLTKVKGGDRPRTNIAPTFVLKDGELVMALGAAGGPLIPPAVVQVISRVIDQGMSPQEAVAAPRVMPKLKLLAGGFDAGILQVEATPKNGWSKESLAALVSHGVELEHLTKYALFGRVHLIARPEDSSPYIAVADPDWEGSAQALP